MDSRRIVWTDAKARPSRRIGVSGAMGGTSVGSLFRGTERDLRCYLSGCDNATVNSCGSGDTERWLLPRLERRIVRSSGIDSGGP